MIILIHGKPFLFLLLSPVLRDHPGGVGFAFHSCWNVLELDVGVAVVVDLVAVTTTILLRPHVCHDGPDVQARKVVALGIGNLIVLVILVVVIAHVVTDLMAEGSSA